MTPATLIIVGRIVAFLGAAAAAVGLGLTGAKLALVVSTWILAGLVGSHLLLDLGWIRLEVNTASTTGETPKDWSAAFKDGANLVITVEGVILGLVFAFVVGKGTGGTLVNIGAASLAAGVVVGILLYSLVLQRWVVMLSGVAA